ncbi:hypothetical protein NQ317_013355 [Molorchus minor]|uniref:Uncharacterized protein n=1 Tax=Molorchus minor TaxID=1323400 RepID=A0ABQ9JMJ0_9CUCU|nr:hypothetical protein NQ317_013355 [Molorchus minor]
MIYQMVIKGQTTEKNYTVHLTSAPNHNCPARFSCSTSSGNFTLKSLLALSSLSIRP